MSRSSGDAGWQAVLALRSESSLPCHLSLSSLALPAHLRSWSIPTQYLLLLHVNRSSSIQGLCRAGWLAQADTRWLTGCLYRGLSWLSLLTAMPLRTGQQQLDAACQCAALLRFLRVGLGLLAPLAWQAASEASLFAAHQRRLRAAGLPLERGWNARLYSAVHGLCREPHIPYLWVLAAMMLGSCWDLAVMLSTPPAAIA